MTAESKNLSIKVFSTLKRRVLRWEYPPGYRLTEEAISEEFEVSRSPVREALRMLTKNNLVEKVPYHGYTVKQPNLEEIRELYDVRLALELFVVERLSDAGMDQGTWDDLYQKWHTLSIDPPLTDIDMAGLDEEFHETLARATGNRTLEDLLHTLNERLRFVRLTDFTAVERRRETRQQHVRILASISARDGPASREAIRQNIGRGCMNVEAAVKEVLARAYMK